jgi:Phage gp6-like head-tail connector protein
MPLSETALLDLEEAKAYLKVEHDEENELIENLINQVTSRLERRYDRIFVARDLVDTVRGQRDEFLWLRYPIISVTSVRYADDPTPIPAAEYDIVEDQGYLGNRFWSGPYVVTYRAGYERFELPDWIKSEAMELLSVLYEGRGGQL